MLAYGIFRAVQSIDGTKFNNRQFKDSREYRNLQSIRANAHYIRHGGGQRANRRAMRRNRKTAALLLVMVALFLIAQYLVLPHLSG